MRQYNKLVRESILLDSFSIEEINAYLKDGSFRLKTYDKNSFIHFSGEVCSKLEIILSGRISIERIDDAGNLMPIAEFSANDILGGNLLFSKKPFYPMMITAKQPAVILEITKERLFSLFAINQIFLRTYLEFISDHTALLGDHIKHYVNKTIRECIMSYLEHERLRQGTNRIQLTLTKKAWAEKIGVQRTSLSRELAKMRKEGLIRYETNWIQILQTNLLGE